MSMETEIKENRIAAKSVVFSADRAHHMEMMSFVEETLEEFCCPMKASMIVSVAADEIIANVCDYAYAGAKGELKITVLPLTEPAGVRIEFTDTGIPFNPLEKEDPDITLGLAERPIGGLGIFMVKKTMDRIQYEYVNDSNVLIIDKYY